MENGSEFFAPKLKKPAIDEAKAKNGETGFAISKPSGKPGEVKTSDIDSFVDFSVETKRLTL